MHGSNNKCTQNFGLEKLEMKQTDKPRHTQKIDITHDPRFHIDMKFFYQMNN
jgi:hypothetical protein